MTTLTPEKPNPHLDYWDECLSSAFDDAGVYALFEQLTSEQRRQIANVLLGGHENHGMAFYSPPPSDRHNQIEREWKAKYEALERKFEAYQGDAETAVKKALRQHHDASVSIGKHGEVLRHGGRTEIIQ